MSVQGKIAESGQIAEQTAPGVSDAPRPWVLGDDDYLRDANDELLADFRFFVHPADERLAFIMRAVNSHDALVKALEEMIEVYWGDGDGELPEPHCIQNALAALASAREVQP